MISWYLAAYITFSCPGGMFGRFIPSAARPWVCTQEIEIIRTSKRKTAEKKLRAAGCGSKPLLYWCQGLKCWEKKVSCETKMKFEH